MRQQTKCFTKQLSPIKQNDSISCTCMIFFPMLLQETLNFKNVKDKL